MLSVEIHRDLTRYRAKVVGGLTARSLACTAAALLAGVAAYGWLTWALEIPFEEVSILVYGVTLPFWALGFLEPQGMRPERWLPLWVRQHFGASRLTYDNAARLRRALEPDDDVMGATHAEEQSMGRTAGRPARRATSREYGRVCRRQRGLELWEPSRAYREGDANDRP